MDNVICPYCHKPAELLDSEEIYGYGTNYGKFWCCINCNAWVGTHKNSKDHVPLGRLANQELRTAKRLAHAAFDQLWKRKMEIAQCSKSEARKAGYGWLAKRLEIDLKKCHIGYFDVDHCMKTVDICVQVRRK